jgi:hypothetical protein
MPSSMLLTEFGDLYPSARMMSPWLRGVRRDDAARMPLHVANASDRGASFGELEGAAWVCRARADVSI